MASPKLTLVPIKTLAKGRTMAHFANLTFGDGDPTMIRQNFFGTGMRLEALRELQLNLFQQIAETQAAEDVSGYVFVPISARLLDDGPNEQEVVQALEEMNSDHRARLVPEVHDLPADPSLETVEQATVPLLSYFQTYVADLHPKCTDTTVFANCNYMGVSINLRDSEDPRGWIKRAWALASTRRLKLFVWNIEDESTRAVARDRDAHGATGDI